MDDATLNTGHVLYVGAGGNIGSHAVALLARSRHVRHMTLVDPDSYARHNLVNQAITGSMVGRPKVAVQGEIALGINPTLSVTTHHCAVEELPLSMLCADLLLSGVDNRAARQHLNEVAAHLGTPWIDAGVQSDGLLARVERFGPGAAAPCLECSWDDADYAALEQRYPCEGAPQPTPSASPPALGALVASMQVLEGERLLRGDTGGLALGEQVVLSAAHHRHFRTTHRRNPECRMGEHERWDITPLHMGPGASPAAVLRAIARLMPLGLDFTWSVFGRHLARSASCATCRTEQASLHLVPTHASHALTCPTCLAPAVTTGFGRVATITAQELLPLLHGLPMGSLGLRPGDVMTASCGTVTRHFVADRSPALNTLPPASATLAEVT